MPPVRHETVVIGGGPAGSAAAIQLARAGKPVCLLERKQVCHHKVCGEFISWEAGQYLKAVGVDLAAQGAQLIHQFRLYDGEASLETDLPFTAWSLSRRQLDACLLEQAERAGALVHRGTTVRNLYRTHDSWHLETAPERSFLASTVFLASGKHDIRNWRRMPPPQGQDLIGLKMHLRLSDKQQAQLRETVEIHLFNGGYAGLEPVEEGKANLCFLVSKDVYQACNKSWPALLTWLSEKSSHLNTRLAGAASVWAQPMAVYGTPYGYLHSPTAAMSGLFRLGDQAAVIPSFAGDGIAIALHSGFLAARVHASGGDAKRYHLQANKDFGRPVRNAQRLAHVLSHAQGRRVAFMLSRHLPWLMTYAIRHTRLAPQTSAV